MSVLYFGHSDADPEERWKFWESRRSSAVTIDIETISLDERHPLGIGIGFSPEEAFYFELQGETPVKGLEALRPLISDVRITKAAHNWMFDMGVFPLIPVIGNSLDRANIFDTNVAARLLGHRETSLPILSFEYGKPTQAMGDVLKANGCTDNQQLIEKNPQALAEHCATDCMATYQLYLEFVDRIRRQYAEYFKVEMAVMPILLDLSMQGIAIDEQARQDLDDRYQVEVATYADEIRSYGVEKPSSTQQIGYILAKRGNFLKLTKSKRQLRTRTSDLEFIDDPLAKAVIQYRAKSKFLSTYLEPLKGEDRFYTEYYLDTAVGRLNSRNRNIQNIPGADIDTGDPGARFMLMPEKGCFTTGDYSQEHPRILAVVSQDREMLRVFETGQDIHMNTAKKLNVPRDLAKRVNNAMHGGATPSTVSVHTKIKDERTCSRFIEEWCRVYKSAADWIRYAQEEGLKTGWALPTLFGRSIRIPEEFNNYGKLNQDSMRRKSSSYPILGSDGEVIKRAIILCNNRRLGPPTMAITVHDSITWDGDVKDRIPVDELENIPGFRVPFEVKQTFRWE